LSLSSTFHPHLLTPGTTTTQYISKQVLFENMGKKEKEQKMGIFIPCLT